MYLSSRIAVMFLFSSLSVAVHAQADLDLSPVVKVARSMRQISTAGRGEKSVADLYNKVRGASELLSDSSLCTIDLGVCAQSAETRTAIKTILNTELGTNDLKWWADNVDLVIARWSESQPGLAKGLKALNFEVPSGSEKPKWKRYLKNTAMIVGGLPLMLLLELGRSPLDFSPNQITSYALDAMFGLNDEADLRRAINVLGFRRVILEAYAETCPGSLIEPIP